jgi:hypothetical protein
LRRTGLIILIGIIGFFLVNLLPGRKVNYRRNSYSFKKIEIRKVGREEAKNFNSEEKIAFKRIGNSLILVRVQPRLKKLVIQVYQPRKAE